MTAVLAARQAREEAFEQAMSGAGKLLQRELDHAGAQGFEAWKVACKRAAWERYSNAGQRVGDAYRAAMAAPLDMPAGVEALNLVYREVGYGQTAELFYDMPGYQARLIELAAMRGVSLEYTGIVRGETCPRCGAGWSGLRDTSARKLCMHCGQTFADES